MENFTVEPGLKVEFRKSRVGSEILVINGYKYTVNRRSGKTVYWRCAYSWCHTRAVIKAGQLCSVSGNHVCLRLLENEILANEQIPQLQQNLLAGLPENVTEKNKSNSHSKAEDTSTQTNGSFLEFVEDRSMLTKTQYSDDVCDADVAWKKRILKGLKVYSEAEQHRRFKVAYDNRKAWLRNKKYFSEKISGCISKWTNSNATWVYSNDWPTRSHCMKLTKPMRGTGVFVEQPLVPIKIIEHVNPPSLERNVPEESKFYEMEQTAKKMKSIKTHKDKVNEIRKSIAVENGGGSQDIVKNEAIKRFRNEGKCPICGKMFQSALERHLNVHYGIKPYKCEHCDKEHSYRAHVRIHNSDTPFSCTVCPKKFTSNGTLKRHLMSHSSGRTFPCNICGKAFRKCESLDFHTCKFQGEQEKSLKSEVTTDIENEEGDIELRTHGRRSVRIKRRKNVSYDVMEEDYKKNLSETINLHPSEKALRQRIEQTHQNYENAKPLRSTICKLSLEELKYADFLQPKVVLSKSLSVTITQAMSEAEICKPRATSAINNLWFHNYAKPFKW